MAISKEDKSDVKNAMGKALANKVGKVTRDNTSKKYGIAMWKLKGKSTPPDGK